MPKPRGRASTSSIHGVTHAHSIERISSSPDNPRYSDGGQNSLFKEVRVNETFVREAIRTIERGGMLGPNGTSLLGERRGETVRHDSSGHGVSETIGHVGLEALIHLGTHAVGGTPLSLLVAALTPSDCGGGADRDSGYRPERHSDSDRQGGFSTFDDRSRDYSTPADKPRDYSTPADKPSHGVSGGW